MLGTPRAPGPASLLTASSGPADAGETTGWRCATASGAPLLAGHAGPGQYWFWDRAYRANLYPEYTNESRLLARSGFAENPDARPAPIEVATGMTGDLTLRPGRGAAEKSVYDLPRDATATGLPGLSARILPASAAKEPLRFRFVAKEPGVARFAVGQVSRNGGALRIAVNGGTPVVKTWPATERDARLREEIEVPFGAGRERDRPRRPPGPTGVSLASITLPGIGTGVTAASLRSDRYALARARVGEALRNRSEDRLDARPAGRNLRAASVSTSARETEKDSRVILKGGLLTGYVPVALDEGFALVRK